MTSELPAHGEPFLWGFGGALLFGLLMIVGFVALVLWNGLMTFAPRPVQLVILKDGSRIAGELTRSETYRPGERELATRDGDARRRIDEAQGLARRTLYRIGNFDLYNEDYRWVSDADVARVTQPRDIFVMERLEWGPFIGYIRTLKLDRTVFAGDSLPREALYRAQEEAVQRRRRVREIERDEIGAVNRALDTERLRLRRVALREGEVGSAYREALEAFENRRAALQRRYDHLAEEARRIKTHDAEFSVTVAEVGGKEKTFPLSQVVRLYPANDLSGWEKARVYLSRWAEFLSQEPREANTEGGVMPAIFGTFVMTVMMALAVAPFGVMAALYLREYARQGRMTSIVRICVNNLAGVPSIVYGVFGLGFFAYLCGGAMDRVFFPERLPNPTFGTGGLLWASLTLALLTVPVVIVATEEALAAVPQSMREGSLGCGASKWQTIKYIVLPRALPGIMTGLILAMARGAGEVAPLMLVGVVKLAPELPLDGVFPYLHLERSFMHLGFHIFDVGFQSRNSEAAKPMVFATTLLLIGLVAVMNAAAIGLRNRLKRRYQVGHF